MWLSFMVRICKMISSGLLNIFSKILIFWVHRGIKEKKMVQNYKKLCLLCSISQELYIIWLSFMVQMCKIIISPDVFFNFKILIFWFVRRAERAKNGPKWRKILPASLRFSGTVCTSCDCDFWYTCIKWWYLSKFFHFIKFWFLGFLGGKRAKDYLTLPFSVCFALYLRNCRSCRLCHQDFDNDVYRHFSFFFFFKIRHCKY